eukprot:6206492-Pleurochrysis_carterae.AAC.3
MPLAREGASNWQTTRCSTLLKHPPPNVIGRRGQGSTKPSSNLERLVRLFVQRRDEAVGILARVGSACSEQVGAERVLRDHRVRHALRVVELELLPQPREHLAGHGVGMRRCLQRRRGGRVAVQQAADRKGLGRVVAKVEEQPLHVERALNRKHREEERLEVDSRLAVDTGASLGALEPEAQRVVLLAREQQWRRLHLLGVDVGVGVGAGGRRLQQVGAPGDGGGSSQQRDCLLGRRPARGRERHDQLRPRHL